MGNRWAVAEQPLGISPPWEQCSVAGAPNLRFDVKVEPIKNGRALGLIHQHYVYPCSVGGWGSKNCKWRASDICELLTGRGVKALACGCDPL